jgi:hypothetical protein
MKVKGRSFMKLGFLTLPIPVNRDFPSLIIRDGQACPAARQGWVKKQPIKLTIFLKHLESRSILNG